MIEGLPGGRELLAAIAGHEILLAWIFGGSLVAFAGTLVAVPMIIARLPADHFVTGRGESRFWKQLPDWARPLLLGAKNLLGGLFLAFGILMLAIPGQGLITILIGLSLIDFPGKHRLEGWLIARPSIQRATSWIRRRAGREPFEVD